MILTKDSLVKSLANGFDNLAVANNSFESLYNPIVVINTLGLLAIESNCNTPSDLVNDGLVE